MNKGAEFETWWENEGKDILPIKDSVKIAWMNAVYLTEEKFNSKLCKTCRFKEPYKGDMHECGILMALSIAGAEELISNDYGCNKHEDKVK